MDRENLVGVRSEILQTIRPDVSGWIERSLSLQSKSRKAVQAEYRQLEAEIRSVVGQDYLQVFGAIVAKTRIPDTLTAALMEFEADAMRLLSKIEALQNG